MWSDAESNHGHEDFQSSALPTELSDHKKHINFCQNTLLNYDDESSYCNT